MKTRSMEIMVILFSLLFAFVVIAIVEIASRKKPSGKVIASNPDPSDPLDRKDNEDSV